MGAWCQGVGDRHVERERCSTRAIHADRIMLCVADPAPRDCTVDVGWKDAKADGVVQVEASVQGSTVLPGRSGRDRSGDAGRRTDHHRPHDREDAEPGKPGLSPGCRDRLELSQALAVEGCERRPSNAKAEGMVGVGVPLEAPLLYQADRAEVDRAMREGREVSTNHMSEKIRHPGNHF
jgi:hypothetical protein